MTKPIKKATLLEALFRYTGESRPAPATEIEVAVEDWLKPVIPEYLEKRREDVGRLRTALAQGDYGAVRTLGHQMAGSGAGYGFTEITNIGTAIEESALAGDPERIQSSIDALDRYLRHVVAR